MAESPTDRMRAQEDADMAALRKQGVNVRSSKVDTAAERRFAAMKDDSAALDKFRAEKAQRASDEAYLLAEADKFDKLTPQKQAERDRIKQMKADADKDWDSMGKGKEGEKSPANAEQDKETYGKEQSTEQTAPKDKKKSDDQAAETPTDVTTANTPPPTVVTDVVNDFDWTASINKQQMAEKIPYIRLTEFKLTANNAMNGFAAAAMAFADVHRSSVAGAGKLGGAAQAMTQSTFMAPAGEAAAGAANMIGSAGAAVAPYLQKAENFIKSKANDSFGSEGQHLMDLFGNLYAREATGRVYVMPYYTRDYFQANNSFSDSTESMPPVVGKLFEGVTEAGKIPSLVEPGVYVQRPKFYQFAGAPEPTLNFTLTLYNTLTPMSYLKHAKFIQQLALNNLPRRFTRVVVEPPCIYEVFVPGKAFFPYCFVSSLKISNVGNRRLINNEIVPDAFQIDISLTSLIKDASNLYERQMQHHGLGTPSEGGAGGTAGDLAGGGGNDMGAAGIQRDAIASVDAAASPGSGSSESPSERVDRTITSLNKNADKLDQIAAQQSKSGNTQKAAEAKAEADGARQSAQMMVSHRDYDNSDARRMQENRDRINAQRAARGEPPLGPPIRYENGKRVN